MQRTMPRVSQMLETSLYVEDLDRSRAVQQAGLDDAYEARCRS